MANRGGGQIIDARSHAPIPNPLEYFAKAISGLGATAEQHQQLMAYQRQLEISQQNQLAAKQQEDAVQQQALAQLMTMQGQSQPGSQVQAQPAPSPGTGPAAGLQFSQVPTPPQAPAFSPQAQAAYNSVMGPLGTDTSKRNVGERSAARLRQAPIALKIVEQERAKSGALAELDRLTKEAQTSTDPLLARGKQARLSALSTARAAVQAGSAPDQIGQLVTQLGGTEGASIALALDRQRLQTGQDTRAEVGWATKRLAQVAPEFAGVADLPGGYSEAPRLLASFTNLSREEAQQERLIASRESSAIRTQADAEKRQMRVQAEGARLDGESRAAQAYASTMEAQLQLLSADPQYQSNPEALISEAANRAGAILQRVSPKLAKQFEQNGTQALVSRFMRGVEEIRGYTRSAIQTVGSSVQTTGSRPVTEKPISLTERSTDIARDPVGVGIRNLATKLGAPTTMTREFLPAPLDAKQRDNIRTTAIKHMQVQMGVNEGEALAMWTQSGADTYFSAYNQGVAEARKNPPPEFQGGATPEQLKQVRWQYVSALLRDIGHKVAPGMVEARSPLTQVELQAKFWRDYLGHQPGIPQSIGATYTPPTATGAGGSF